MHRLLQPPHERYIAPYSIALVHNSLGEKGEALACLERGFEQHDLWLVFLKVDPKWKNLRDEPRYQTLPEQMNFLQ